MRPDLNLDDLAAIADPFDGESASWPQRPPPAIRPASGAARQTRSMLHRRRYAALAAAFAFEIAWVLFVQRRPDLAVLPAWQIALGLLIPWVALAVALGAAVHRGAIGLGASTNALKACLLLSPCLFAIGTWAIAPHALERPAALFWGRAAVCALLTGILTAVPLGLAVFAFRRAFVAASALRTAVLGVACGALAASTMSIVCPHGAALHVLLGHGTMMVVGGILGALVGRHVARA